MSIFGVFIFSNSSGSWVISWVSSQVSSGWNFSNGLSLGSRLGVGGLWGRLVRDDLGNLQNGVAQVVFSLMFGLLRLEVALSPAGLVLDSASS